MLSKKLLDGLNKQINEEYYSSYIYLAMAAYLEDANLDGCAHWMRMQAEEEWQHGMKIFNYLSERGGKIQLKAIACVAVSPTSLADSTRCSHSSTASVRAPIAMKHSTRWKR